MTTVYTKNNCVQCEQTKRLMDRLELSYDVVNISEHPTELDRLIKMGYTAAPVVITDTDSWAGFNPDKIKDLAA